MTGYVGEIRIFAGSFAPRGWLLCHGQTLTINPTTASLFSLIKYTYGGSNQNFKIPDLSGRAAVGVGTGSALSQYTLGEKAGDTTVTLTPQTMPTHAHSVGIANTSNFYIGFPTIEDDGNLTTPVGAVAALAPDGAIVYSHGSNNLSTYPMAEQTAKITDKVGVAVDDTGQNKSHNNMMPSLVCNFIICVQGDTPYSGT